MGQRQVLQPPEDPDGEAGGHGAVFEEQRHGTLTEAQSRLIELEERARKLRESKEQVSALREKPDTELLKESMLVKVPEFEEISTEVNPNLLERLSGGDRGDGPVSKLLHEDLDRAVGTALGHDKQASPQDKRPILAVVPSPAAPFAPGLREGFDSHRCSLTFDPRTANGHLFLTRGNTRAEHLSSGPRELPEDEARFDHTWQVLCCPGFSQGAHYWGAGGVQALGLRRGDIRVHPEEEEGQTVHGGHERAVLEPAAGRETAERVARRPTGDCECLPLTHCRIGVHLDYDGGTLTFYGPDQSRLHAFHHAFTQTLFPACWIGEGVSVSLCSSGT
ncbi:hypothetical protein WMY93_010224 [Mugilogobius chulae]|uniref:B30.2/SPRY domain-containing protein n=1 Tax=Mugilogobius chulae TaxID=88201 RepID=A0AAW0P806_9GOBI